jgi:hypothetical protein
MAATTQLYSDSLGDVGDLLKESSRARIMLHRLLRSIQAI